jgi:hypothetical protein
METVDSVNVDDGAWDREPERRRVVGHGEQDVGGELRSRVRERGRDAIEDVRVGAAARRLERRAIRERRGRAVGAPPRAKVELQPVPAVRLINDDHVQQRRG